MRKQRKYSIEFKVRVLENYKLYKQIGKGQEYLRWEAKDLGIKPHTMYALHAQWKNRFRRLVEN